MLFVIARSSLINLVFSLIIFSLLFFNSARAQENKTLTIFTEPNLAIAMTQIARKYSQQYNVITSINFNSPADLIAEIDMGEAADVIITAHEDSIETLKLKGLVDIYNIGHIAYDTINLVTSRKNDKLPLVIINDDIDIKEALAILNDIKATLILDNYGSSSGRVSGDYLRTLNLKKFKVYTKLAEDRSPIVNSIIANDDYYALLLSSQIENKKQIRVIAKVSDVVADYKLLVVAGNNMDTARQFLRFFNSDEARKIILSSGLLIEK